MRLLFTLGFIISFLTSFGIESNDSEKKLLKSARKHFLYGEYEDAIEKYKEAIQLNPESPELYFELGLCYFENDISKEKALPYFQLALKKSTKDTIPELLYYLAQSYQFNQEFDQAILYYKLFDKMLKTSKDGVILKRETKNFVTMCENGQVFLNRANEKIEIENLGNIINSDFSEYAPVINSDGNILVFTARKKGSTGGEFFHDNKYFEDIYVSELTDTVWSSPKKLDENSKLTEVKLNYTYHDAAIAFNNDETSLYIYRDNDIWKAPISNKKISDPQPMSDMINTSEHEPSVYLTPDGNTLILVSNKEGGLGGRDLYISSKKSDGTWSTASNLGNKINTDYDDDAPFITHDGRTLYFSSKGHNSIGGYDIFKSSLGENGQWSDPENLGLPINSPGDDIFYVEDGKGIGYFSSDRSGGIGSMDIYRIKTLKEEEELIDTTILSTNDSIASPLLSSTADSVASPLMPVTKISNAVFEMNYDYNIFGISDENKNYQKFISDLVNIVKVTGKVTLSLESSASTVPTTTYKSNHNLALIRLNEAADKIKKDLLRSGVKEDQIFIDTFNATVQGPVYNDDFEINKSAYLPYQYFKAKSK